MTHAEPTLNLIRQLIARRARLEVIVLWMDRAKPGYAALFQELASKAARITADLAKCAEDLATTDGPNLDGVREGLADPQPWFMDPAVGPAEVAAQQALAAEPSLVDLLLS